MRRVALLGLLCTLAASGAQARPGGGSSFRGSSSSGSSSFGSSYRSSSSSSYSSRSSSSSRPRSHSPSPTRYVPPVVIAPTIVNTSHMVRRPQDRRESIVAWQQGSLGPYGAGPPRPASLTVQRVTEFDVALTMIWISVGLLLGAGLVVFLLWLLVRFLDRRVSGWTTAVEHAMKGLVAQGLGTLPVARLQPVRKQLEEIRTLDPDFSVVLLEDFLYALYAEAQTARGQGALDRLGPYLSPAAREALDVLGQHKVHGIVIGAMRFLSFSPMPRLGLSVEFEANYAEEHEGGTRGFYTRERWFFARSPVAHSRPPERVHVFGCPSCGAPIEKLLAGTCPYCKRLVNDGDVDWMVESIELVERESRGPMLIGTVEEEGTELPTIVDAALTKELERLRAKDPAFDVENLRGRIQRIFHVMQKAWSTLQWQQARPFLSDNLFEAQGYWIAAYRQQGLRNITEGAEISRIELVRITQDRWFDAATVRVHAHSTDYTLRDSDGRVVGGDKTKIRSYTEYWTLIRGTARTGASRADDNCPSCGAPLEVSMAAICQHCQAKVNSGAFDWVLSRIEQDEVYKG